MNCLSIGDSVKVPVWGEEAAFRYGNVEKIIDSDPPYLYLIRFPSGKTAKLNGNEAILK
jgi:hypothetical protein